MKKLLALILFPLAVFGQGTPTVQDSTLVVSARTASTSFVINSVNGDANIVAWLLIEHSP
jgi:hypothetical protein